MGGHLIFAALHLAAVMYAGAVLLFLTIPAHLIYAAVLRRSGGEEAAPARRARAAKAVLLAGVLVLVWWYAARQWGLVR